MKFAIIAAGEGRRITEGVEKTSKPMMLLRGEPMIGRLLRIFSEYHPTEIIVVCREGHYDVIAYLEAIQQEGLAGTRIPLRVVTATTPSSMHSLEVISSYLSAEPFLLTTVDTIFREREFSAFVSPLEKTLEDYDGCFVVTDFVDDEKPLYVGVDASGKITGFYDHRDTDIPFVSGGIYAMRPACLEVLHQCVRQGEQRLRNFQRALLRNGQRIKAWPFRKIIDVDHPSDLLAAIAFLEEEQ
ncbi:MAG: NDP-sugar synthase [Prevotella sp.]|nr:NDP-sugar synthase [Prevotella sp.]